MRSPDIVEQYSALNEAYSSDIAIRAVEAAVALRENVAYEIIIGFDHEREFSYYDGPPAAGPILQSTRAGTGVPQLT